MGRFGWIGGLGVNRMWTRWFGSFPCEYSLMGESAFIAK